MGQIPHRAIHFGRGPDQGLGLAAECPKGEQKREHEHPEGDTIEHCMPHIITLPPAAPQFKRPWGVNPARAAPHTLFPVGYPCVVATSAVIRA